MGNTVTLAELMRQLEQLTLENRQVRAEMQQLRNLASNPHGHAAPPSAPTTSTGAEALPERRSALKPQKPESFDPSQRDANVRTWLFMLNNYFAASGVQEADAQQRIEYAVTLLRGPALEWWRQLTFDLVNASEAARKRLRHFRQIGNVQEYTRRFLSICNEIDDITEAEMRDRYLEGLKPDIAEVIAIHGLSTFESVVAAAERVDAVRSRRGRDDRDRGYNRPINDTRSRDGPSPMEIGAVNIDTAVNFKDARMVDRTPLHIGPVIRKLRVVLGPITVRRDFDSATLDGYDFIFGRDWLRTVSTQFDWAQGRCSVKVDGEFRELPQWSDGATSSTAIINAVEAEEGKGGSAAVSEKATLPAEVSALLAEFADVFPDELPPGLPPSRAVDHRIELEPGSRPVAKPQWRLSPAETEEMTQALSRAGTLMNTVLSEFLGSFVVVYLDDILVFSKTKEEHVQHLQKVFEVLRREQLYAKQSKCEFFLPDVEFLGHVVSASGIRTDPKKIAAVQDWLAPTSVKELQSFLGFANYYRRFVQEYASIASPLTDLLRKGVEYVWGPAQQQAFEQMKQSLTSSPTLSYPDPTRPYVVVTDASDQAIGAVLLQDQGRGLQPIAYESRKLRGAELNYPIHDKEALAIIHAYKVWRCYLEGADSVIRTDHCSLRFLKSQPQLSRRQARWMEFMEGSFHYRIEYKPGVRNPADPLTRHGCQLTSLTVTAGHPLLTALFEHGYTVDPDFTPQPPAGAEVQGSVYIRKGRYNTDLGSSLPPSSTAPSLRGARRS
ncbi:unnamed protein product [Closterium sp. Yama58-4]|nr:unnamed protein product [Closterium sp. Yama58-4]